MDDAEKMLVEALKEKFRKNPDKFAIMVGDLYKIGPNGERIPTLAKWQRKFLYDNSRRIVVVASRQIGKCLWKNQRVILANGEQPTVEEMYKMNKEFEVLSLDNNFKIKVGKAKVFYNGKKPVYRVVTRTGREIYVTDNHPFLTPEGWKELKDLKENEFIAVPRILPVSGNVRVDERLAYLLGMLVTDGSVTDYISFTTGEDKLRELFEYSLSYFDNVKVKWYKKKESVWTGKVYRDKNNVWKWLEDVGYDIGSIADSKKLPDVVFSWDNESVARLLSAMFSCDGWVNISKRKIGYASKSFELVRQVQHLLLRFGILSNIHVKKVRFGNKNYENYYELLIGKKDSIIKFAHNIGIYSKQDKLNKLVDIVSDKVTSDNSDVIPFNLSNYPYVRGANDEFLKSLATSDVFWDRIKSIEFVGIDDTYDLEVEGYHNFIAGDIIVHNSTITALKAIWYAWLFPNKTIMIISDTGGHALRMLHTIIGFLQRSDNPIVKYINREVVKTNLTGEIIFANGSRILSKTAGMKGDPIRGYTLDMAIVDEAQLVPNEAFEVLKPALLVRKGQLILIGTPPKNYRSTYFYKAWIDPNWSKHKADVYDRPWMTKKEIDEFMEEYRREHGEGAFRREILGEFFDDDSAFFLGEAVQRVMRIPDSLQKPASDYSYVMAIDPAGMGTAKTAFAIVGFDVNRPEDPYELHYLEAKEKIGTTAIVNEAKMIANRWKPVAIVVDANGVGLGVYDVLKNTIGQQYKVYPFKPFGKTRMEMYFRLREKIEDERIILINRSDLLDSFLSFEYDVTKSGDIRVVKTPGKADLVDAVGMAVWYIDNYLINGANVRFVYDEEFSQSVNEFLSGDMTWRPVPKI